MELSRSSNPIAVPIVFPSFAASCSPMPFGFAAISAAFAASCGAARSAPSTSAFNAASCAASAAAYTSSIAFVGSIISVRATFAQYCITRAPREMVTTP